MAQTKNAYDFVVKDIKGQPYDMKQRKGQVTMIMNTASQCGFTKSGYTAATELYTKYKDQGFTVLGFPCNQFGGQEPGSGEEIQNFVCTRFKAEFPMMEKVDVNGPNTDPLWEYLKNAQKGIMWTTRIKWNFTSFLVDKNGVCRHRFSPGSSASSIESKLLELLKE